MAVFDREGNFLAAWGEEVLEDAHGIFIDGEDQVWCIERDTHCVHKFTRDGELLLTLLSESLQQIFQPLGPLAFAVQPALKHVAKGSFEVDGLSHWAQLSGSPPEESAALATRIVISSPIAESSVTINNGVAVTEVTQVL